MSFPKDFIFCTSTSAYQIEGAWNLDGKGENIWDRLVHTTPEAVLDKTNGDVACDSYHRYEEDVQLVKEIGFQIYRISISWARILPTGDITNVNEAGIQHYHNVIDELRSNGIEPMVTMYHWDLPQRLQDLGGWANPLIVDYFEDYANLLFESYFKKVTWWITLIVGGYANKSKYNNAPNLQLDSPTNYIVAHNILRAHGRVYRLYEKKYRSEKEGKISISLHSRDFEPKTNSKEDKEAAERGLLFELGWFADPIYSKDGDYPETMKKIILENSVKEGRNRSRLPSFTPEEINSIKGSFDFFALNHYTTMLCSPGSPPFRTLYDKDMNVKVEQDPSWPASKAPWLRVVPWGLKNLLVRLKDRYDNVPVLITENGYCDGGKLQDIQRISYYRSYLEEVEKAMKEHGCNVIGYTAWSLLDNFEWLNGYEYRFGLVHVDFNDPERKRTPKASSEFFHELIETRNIPK